VLLFILLRKRYRPIIVLQSAQGTFNCVMIKV